MLDIKEPDNNSLKSAEARLGSAMVQSGQRRVERGWNSELIVASRDWQEGSYKLCMPTHKDRGRLVEDLVLDEETLYGILTELYGDRSGHYDDSSVPFSVSEVIDTLRTKEQREYEMRGSLVNRVNYYARVSQLDTPSPAYLHWQMHLDREHADTERFEFIGKGSEMFTIAQGDLR